MTGEQLPLLTHAWMERHQLRALSHYIEKAFEVGQIDNPTYRAASRWPLWVEHRFPCGGTPPTTLAWLQRELKIGRHEGHPDHFHVYRYVFTNVNGHVFDEGSWCLTEGGARGYLQRVTVPGTRQRATV